MIQTASIESDGSTGAPDSYLSGLKIIVDAKVMAEEDVKQSEVEEGSRQIIHEASAPKMVDTPTHLSLQSHTIQREELGMHKQWSIIAIAGFSPECIL